MKGITEYCIFSFLSFLWILLVGVLLDSGCTFQTPSKPVWEVQFEIPLINRVYTMEEMIDDSDDLYVDSSKQEIVFTIEKEIDTALVGDFLKISYISHEDSVENDTILTGFVSIPDSFIIDTADVSKGQLEVEIKNQGNSQIEVDFYIPNLTLDGDTLSIDTQVISPGATWEDDKPLEDYQLIPWQDNGIRKVEYKLRVKGINPYVRCKVEIWDFSFSRIVGWLNDIDVAIEKTEQEITIPEEIKGLEVASADMKLTILNGIQAKSELDLDILGVNDELDENNIDINRTINPASGSGEPGVTVVDTNVTDFFNILPTSVHYSGIVKVGKGYTQDDRYEIRKDDFVTGTVLFKAPLIVKMDPRINNNEVDTVDIDKGTRDAVRDNLKRLSIVAEIENHTPLSAYVSLFFSKTIGDTMIYLPENRASLLTMDSLGLVPDSLGVYEINAPDTIWYVVESGISQWEMILTDEDELTYFEDEEVYLGVQIVFLGTQGKLVKVMPSDYIGLKAYGSVSVLTKIPEDEEEEGGGS